MRIDHSNIDRNFNTIPVSKFWNTDRVSEIKMHRIHAYPAKFPSFVVSKSIEYAKEEGVEVNNLADVFCGCGTTALEAKRNNINFWGCDINPVATLIARTKSEQYDSDTLDNYYYLISQSLLNSQAIPSDELLNHERINYWFHHEQIIKLNSLLTGILDNIPAGKYRDFFLTAFSNSLKPTSKWLTKSIKPQIDPNKPVYDVRDTFKNQFEFMAKANASAMLDYTSDSTTDIRTENFLGLNFPEPFVDMVVTSPPYVTSYEYADLHQLSTLWLGYTDDYRTLREGTIGSLYHNEISQEEIESLPAIGKEIYIKMMEIEKRKAQSIAKYFIDIQNGVTKIHSIINPGGLAVFVIGNTKYKDVEVNNAKFLTCCMLNEGFQDIEIVKRKISSKILTPYRDKKGRFSNDSSQKKVYSHEFVVIGRK